MFIKLTDYSGEQFILAHSCIGVVVEVKPELLESEEPALFDITKDQDHVTAIELTGLKTSHCYVKETVEDIFAKLQAL